MGHIELHSNGWYYSDYYVGPKRIRKRLSVYKDKAQKMQDELEDSRYARRHGEVPRDMSWEFFKDQFRKHRVEADKRTKEFMEQMFEVVDKELDPKLLRHVTPERLLDLKAIMLGEDSSYAPVSAVRILREVKTAMHFAEDMKYVAIANWRLIKLTEPTGRLDFYEKQAYLDLLAALKGGNPSYYMAAFIMGRAGLRLGEFYHLEWQDVQFVSRQIAFRSKPYLDWHIKSDVKGTMLRQIPISLDPLLEAYLKSIARHSGFVLSEDRSSSEKVWAARRFAPVLARTGFRTHLGKEATAHTLRHTFGSHLAQDGVPLTQIRDWMGHSSIRMTERYAHLMPGNQSGFTFKIPENGVSSLCPVLDPIQPSKGGLRHSGGDSISGHKSTESDQNAL